MLESNEGPVDLATVPDTHGDFDVAGFGEVRATTTGLCGGLIGRPLLLANST